MEYNGVIVALITLLTAIITLMSKKMDKEIRDVKVSKLRSDIRRLKDLILKRK